MPRPCAALGLPQSQRIGRRHEFGLATVEVRPAGVQLCILPGEFRLSLVACRLCLGLQLHELVSGQLQFVEFSGRILIESGNLILRGLGGKASALRTVLERWPRGELGRNGRADRCCRYCQVRQRLGGTEPDPEYVRRVGNRMLTLLRL